MKRASLVLLAACATPLPSVHLDLETWKGPFRTGDPVHARLEKTCALTFHLNVTDDEQRPAPGVPVHLRVESVERCVEETVASHTLTTEDVLTDEAGRAMICNPADVTRDDNPWQGIAGCSSTFGDPRLVVGTGSKQVVKVGPFADGMTVKLRHGHEASPTSPQK